MSSNQDDGGIDGFMNDKGESGGRSNILNWKSNVSDRLKAEQGSIDIWLHPRSSLVKRWSHSYPIVGRDREEKATIWTRHFTSMETAEVCDKQYFLDDKGARECPPSICPFALSLEWVRQAIAAGKIKWTEVIMRVEAGEKVQEIHAGGWVGQFSGKRVENNPALQRELSKAGIRRDESFKEKGLAQSNYVMVLVDDQNADKGAKVAIEGKALGSKMRSEIEKRRKQTKNPDWTPIGKNAEPTMFRWEYDATKDFSNKYDVTIMPDEDPGPAVEAVFAADPPSVADVTGPSNVAELKRALETAWVHQVVPPWNDLFGPAIKKLIANGQKELTELPEDFSPGDDSEDETIQCDVCGEAMAEDALTCPSCESTWENRNEGFVLVKVGPAYESYEEEGETRYRKKPERASAGVRKPRGQQRREG